MIDKIAKKTMHFENPTWETDIEKFDWNPAIALYGLWKAYKKTGNREYKAYIESWADRQIPGNNCVTTVNSAAPFVTIAELYRENPKAEYYNAMLNTAEFIVNSAPLTKTGALEHTVTEANASFGGQMWADTLFMCCLFLAKFGKIADNDKYVDFAVNQFALHHKYLSDGSGLYFHGYDSNQKNHMSAVRWGRANAWILLGTMELYDILGSDDKELNISGLAARHCDALVQCIKPDGGFATIINDASSYTEISATAGIAAGMIKAQRAGFQGANDLTDIIHGAVSCVESSVNNDGSVTGVSTGTPVLKDEAAYKNVRRTTTLYGQGLAMAMLAEIQAKGE